MAGFLLRGERIWKKIRNAVWQGKALVAIEMTRALDGSDDLANRDYVVGQ